MVIVTSSLVTVNNNMKTLTEVEFLLTFVLHCVSCVWGCCKCMDNPGISALECSSLGEVVGSCFCCGEEEDDDDADADHCTSCI
jgi:hypothetical protein